MPSQLQEIKNLLQNSVNIPEEKRSFFYKTQPGGYAAHDRFIGVNNPTLRSIAKQFCDMSLNEISELLKSPFNEERLVALFILVKQYQTSSQKHKEEIYNLYLNNLDHINNWNLVDASAHYIIGAHLLNQPKDFLFKLVESNNMWERRIAIVATWYFIRCSETVHTVKLAEKLLRDDHDLIHKAVGWMLREVGKKDISALTGFLDQHAGAMPRTMLRYAIEKLTADEKLGYMKVHR